MSLFDVTKYKPEHIPETPVLRFFYFWKENFFNLVIINFLYFMITLPLYGWASSLLVLQQVMLGMNTPLMLPSVIISFSEGIPFVIKLMLVAVSIVCYGPATAGLSYVTMKQVRDLHTEIFRDFFSAFRYNFKQSTVIGIADVIVFFASYYYIFEPNGIIQGFSGVVIKVLWYVLVVFYLAVRTQIYAVMVTVELNMRELWKCSLLIALNKFWRPLLIIIGITVILMISVLADFILYPAFIYSVISLLCSFVAWYSINRLFFEKEKSKND